MNVLIIDPDGVGLDFAMRCVEHGHAVKLFIRPNAGQRDKTGDGLVEKVSDWQKWVRWATVIVPTMNTVYLDALEELRKLGYPVFGPSKESARLEVEREFGMQVFKKHGIDIPPYKMFRTLDEAEAHCWKSDKGFVFKTLGSEEDKSLTHVAKDPADMINTLRRWKKSGMKLKGACMLQDLVQGIEIGVSAWMGRDGFLKTRGENIEHKKLMSNDYGPNTGEMGTVMWYADKSKLARMVLDPMEDYLRSIGHIGDIDVNVIVDESGKPWPLEFTMRLGWPAFWIMCSQHDEPVQWMADALQGKDTLKTSYDVFTGLLMCQPRFPYKGTRDDEVQGLPVQGITENNWSDIHLIGCMAGKGCEMVNGKPAEKDMIVTSGEYILCATGSGATVKKACKAAYETVDSVHVKNKIVRDDIGESLQKDLPSLQALGFATSIA